MAPFVYLLVVIGLIDGLSSSQSSDSSDSSTHNLECMCDIDEILDQPFQPYICVQIDAQLNATAAEFHCNDTFNTNLATIRSESDNNAVRDSCDTTSYPANWIGLKRDSNDIFEWNDGTPLTYENWAQNFPQENGDCVAMLGIYAAAENNFGKWITLPCDSTISTQFFVCNAQETNIREMAQCIDELKAIVSSEYPQAQSVNHITHALDSLDLNTQIIEKIKHQVYTKVVEEFAAQSTVFNNLDSNENNSTGEQYQTLLIISLVLNIVILVIMGIALSLFCKAKCLKTTDGYISDNDLNNA